MSLLAASHETTLLNELITTIEYVGVDKTISLLQRARIDSPIFQNKDVTFIITNSCQRFGISFEELLLKRDTDMSRLHCIQTISFYLYSEFGFNYRDIGRVLKRNKGTICRYFKDIEKLKNNENHALQKHFTVLDAQIREYKLSQNRTNK